MKRFVLALALVVSMGVTLAPNKAEAYGGRYRGGPVARAFAVRLYYSNAFRSYIPGTGYGGFARPAFGWRGY